MGSLQVSNTHFVSLITIEFNMLTYADTLGWGIPGTVKTIFQKISQGLGKPAPLYLCITLFYFYHQPGTDTGSCTVHICFA